MVKNIKEIRLWDEERDVGTKGNYNGIRPVRVEFVKPCLWTTFNLDDLKLILKYWIIGEELKYPTEQGFRGRWMLFDEIKKVFDQTPSPLFPMENDKYK